MLGILGQGAIIIQLEKVLWYINFMPSSLYKRKASLTPVF